MAKGSNRLLVPQATAEVANEAVNTLTQQLDQSKIIDDIYDSELLTNPEHVLDSVRPQINQMKLLIDP